MCKSVQDYADKIAAEVAAEVAVKERTKNIERMLRSGKTPEAIADFCEYDLAEVKAVADNMLATV